MFGLIITLKFKDNDLIKKFSLPSLNEIQKELINFLALEFNKLQIDFPLNLNEFESIWFDFYSMNHLDYIFNYNIYDSERSEWITPWELQDIYNDILEKILYLEEHDGNDYSID